MVISLQREHDEKNKYISWKMMWRNIFQTREIFVALNDQMANLTESKKEKARQLFAFEQISDFEKWRN